MKIKTRLHIIIIVSFGVALAIGWVLFSANQQVIKASEISLTSDLVVKGVAELEIITHDYLMHHEDRAKKQWRLKYNSMSQLMKTAKFLSYEEEILLLKIRHNQESIKSIFDQLATNHEKMYTLDQKEMGIYRELEERLTNRLLLRLQTLISDAFRFGESSHADMATSQQRTGLIIIVFVGTMAAVISAILFFINRSFVKPIAQLQKGIEIIGTGNLDYKIDMASKDEIGQLSRAFDRMTEKLKAVTVSSDKLFEEIAQHQQSKERINHLNAVLKAIRNVNQIIVRETDPDRLIKSVCDNLIATRGYYNVWIALLDESNNFITADEAGLSKEFFRMVDLLKRGNPIMCGSVALEQSGAVVIENPLEACSDCPLKDDYAGRDAISIRLEYGRKLFGIMTVSVPSGIVKNKEELSLFEEVAGDIAFALHGIEADERRRTAEKALHQSERYFRSLLYSMHEDILVIDSDYRITDVNNTFLVTSGFKRENVIGRHCFEVSHSYNEPCDRCGEECMLPEVFETGKPRNYLHEHQHIDGSKVWVDIILSPLIDEKGKVTHVIEAVRDVTDLIRVKDSLRDSEEKYRLLVENANDAIFVAQDEVIKFSNVLTKEMIGYSAEELRKIPFTNYIHPEHKDMILDRHKRRLKGEDLPNTYSFRIVKKTGEELWVQLNVVGITWEGRPATLNFLRDITKEKSLETHLQQAQKMESIGTLAGGIAHDFNNILSPIMMYGGIASMETPGESPVFSYIDQILKAADRAKDLVQQILTFSRQTEKESIAMKVSLIIKEALKLLRASIPSTVEITQHIDAKSDTIFADPTRIHQVLMNLCTNSAYAMRDKGGELDVSLTDAGTDKSILEKHHDLMPGRSYLKLTVSDTGHGMDPAVVERIFDPYFTTKEKGEGTGLGLAVIHGIIKGINGAISVKSAPEKGTTFEIFLPKIETETIKESDIQNALPTGHERILFIDDEKVTVDAAKILLEHLGYRVTARTSSIEALEAFRENPDRFDVVITDQTMPNMTGANLSRELLQIRPDIPIILCTGFSEKINGEIAKNMGIRAFVMKPIVMNDMAASIRKVLDKSI